MLRYLDAEIFVRARFRQVKSSCRLVHNLVHKISRKKTSNIVLQGGPGIGTRMSLPCRNGLVSACIDKHCQGFPSANQTLKEAEIQTLSNLETTNISALCRDPQRGCCVLHFFPAGLVKNPAISWERRAQTMWILDFILRVCSRKEIEMCAPPPSVFFHKFL